MDQIDATQEAERPSLYTGGWRPAIGWIGAAALAYHYIVYPILLWVIAIFAPDGKPPPPTDVMTLWTIVSGTLVNAGLRSFDKLKEIDTKRVGQ